MASDGFRILAIADVHHSPTSASASEELPERLCRMGAELFKRAIADAKARGGFDAIALMGDMLNDGTASDAEEGLDELVGIVTDLTPATPLLVVPGNHDGDPERLLSAFRHNPGARELGGYRFVTFADRYGEGDVCTRSEADRRSFNELAEDAGGPLVVFQHNPIHPVIDSDYPYMHTNRADIMADYSRAGVLLSVSGHYHEGAQPTNADGVTYLTARSLLREPFAYTMITLRGSSVNVEARSLQVRMPVFDCHAHTQFAYCGEGLDAEATIARSRQFGLRGVALVEHAPQLYCSAAQFWSSQHIRKPATWRKRGRHCRMEDFRSAMEPLRDDFVRLGFEVEVDRDGRLTLHDEDRDWADVIVGAVHWLNEPERGLNGQALAAAFLRTTEALLRGGVDVLAHPLRIFRGFSCPVPGHVRTRLAEMLAATDTAAEINYHLNRPDERFLTECVERGVRISMGSDAHRMSESAALNPHCDMLERVAAGRPVDELLYTPPARR